MDMNCQHDMLYSMLIITLFNEVEQLVLNQSSQANPKLTCYNIVTKINYKTV